MNPEKPFELDIPQPQPTSTENNSSRQADYLINPSPKYVKTFNVKFPYKAFNVR